MKAFFKTLFGDWSTLGLIGAVLVIEWALVRAGYPHQGALTLPVLILGGVAWLARR